jgi:hydrogenase maturation protein HypF
MRKFNKISYLKIQLPFKVKRPVLALGAHTKNTVCFIKDNFALLSAEHLDLNCPEDLLGFEKDVKYFLKKNPKIIAYDLHPEYQSTKYAISLNAKPASPAGRRYTLHATQHHHAHIASCMAENGLKNQRVIGVSFDGTGLGQDNRIWGAEFLVCDYANFKRAAHLKEIPLLGGQQAIIEPARLTVAWLYLLYKDKFLDLDIDFVKKMEIKRWIVYKRLLLSGFNSPLASSMGRLFDAAGCLILAKHKVNFEAQLAIELERLATSYKLQATSYRFSLTRNKDKYILGPTPIFKQIILDLRFDTPKEKIAYRFHLSIAQMINKVCLILGKENRINTVVLSGGVFQNKLLLNLSLDLLYKYNFKVFTHKALSCNDSNISLGQAVIANYRA